MIHYPNSTAQAESRHWQLSADLDLDAVADTTQVKIHGWTEGSNPLQLCDSLSSADSYPRFQAGRVIGDGLYPWPEIPKQVRNEWLSAKTNNLLQVQTGYLGYKVSDDKGFLNEVLEFRFAARSLRWLLIVAQADARPATFHLQAGIGKATVKDIEVDTAPNLSESGLAKWLIDLNTGSLAVTNITLTIKKLAQPKRRVRLFEVAPSYPLHFQSNDIIKAQLTKKIAGAKEYTIGGVVLQSMDITVYSDNQRLKETTAGKLHLHLHLDGRKIPLGIYYIKEVQQVSHNTLKIRAEDYLSRVRDQELPSDIAQNQSFADILSDRMQLLGYSDTWVDPHLHIINYPYYITAKSILKSLQELAESSSALIIINPQAQSRAVDAAAALASPSLVRHFRLNDYLKLKSKPAKQHPNAVRCSYQEIKPFYDTRVAASVTLDINQVTVRNLNLDNRTTAHKYKIGFGYDASYSETIDIKPWKDSFSDFFLTKAFERGVFEWSWEKDPSAHTLTYKIWLFQELPVTEEIRYNIVLRSHANEKILTTLEATIEPLPKVLDKESIQPQKLSTSVDDLAMISSVIPRNDYVEGTFEYEIAIKQRTVEIEVWNLGEREQTFSADIYGKKLEQSETTRQTQANDFYDQQQRNLDLLDIQGSTLVQSLNLAQRRARAELVSRRLLGAEVQLDVWADPGLEIGDIVSYELPEGGIAAMRITEIRLKADKAMSQTLKGQQLIENADYNSDCFDDAIFYESTFV